MLNILKEVGFEHIKIYTARYTAKRIEYDLTLTLKVLTNTL